MFEIVILILGLAGGAYLKEKELKVSPTVTESRALTLIEQADKACDGNILKFDNRGLGFECKEWKK